MHLKSSLSEPLNNREQNFLPLGYFQWFIRAVISCLFVLLLLTSNLVVNGQTDETIQVLAPEIDAFPVVSIQFKLNNNALPVDTDLHLEQLTVIEKNIPVQVLSLEKAYAGLYFTLAINGARDLDLRDTYGQSIFDKMSDSLVEWASSRSYNFDDAYSLVHNEGSATVNLDDPEDWIVALDEYQPNFRKLEQSLTSLVTSIQLASDRVVPFGVDKAILYITPPPIGTDIDHVNALGEQARSAGIQVCVWMVGDALFLDNDQGKALINLANNTGGQFHHYTEPEQLPDPDTGLTQQGFSHILSYESDVRETGSYPVGIEVSIEGQIIRGESVPFYIEISPPNPMFVNPPTRISRWAELDESDQMTWTPDAHKINILIDFPDDRPRDVAASRLYVDGEKMIEQTSPPFDTLSWDLTGLIEPGEHTLQVEVVDIWGLSSRSIITPVQIEVDLPEPEPPFPVQKIILAAVILVTAAAVLILIIWLARRGWKLPDFLHRKVRVPKASEAAPGNVVVVQNPEGKIYASLIPLDCPSENIEASVIPITQTRVTFGSDPTQAGVLLNLPDVGSIQADLFLKDELFWLRDLGSPAGTWVNYDHVGSEPVQIQAGDIIHFGNFGFRFTMVGTEALTEINVSRYEPIL